jgi:8-oxo-dGTP diphosphatase
MPHIHTELGQHDHTVSAYIVRESETPGEVELLLHVHKKIKKWMQPGGHVELNENPWEAISHEIHEETGYTMEELDLFQPNLKLLTTLPSAVVHPYPLLHNTHETPVTGHKHTDTSYLFFAHEDANDFPGEGESTAFLWVTRSELQALTPDQITRTAQIVGDYALSLFQENEWDSVGRADTWGK